VARFSGAEWIGPTPNETSGGQVDVLGLVLHIQEGTESGSEAWFKDPAAQASAHFLNPKSGNLRQLVDTADRSWAEVAGNRHWLSVENEGYSGDTLTDSQVENVAQLYAWIHKTYNASLQSTDDPNGSGLGWHGMGGNAWGGHFDCPGDPIKAQRPRILARVGEILGSGTAPVPAPTPPPVASGPAFPGEYLSVKSPMLHDNNVREWQQRMHDRGWTITVDGWYGPASANVCRAFQQEKGLQSDGIVGPITWTSVFRTDNVT
jgi:hypothetical protein